MNFKLIKSTFIQRFNRREVWLLLASLSILWVVIHPPKALEARHNAWKARQAIKDADQACKNGDWQSAQDRAEQGLNWAPNSYRLRYLMVTAAAAQEKSIDPALLARTFLDPSASPEEKAGMLTIALDRGDQVTFSRLYNTVDESVRSFPSIVIQRMRLSFQLGRHAEIEAMFEQLSEAARTPTARYIRIGALVQAGDYLEAQNAISQFLATTEYESADAREALRMLTGIPQDRLHQPALESVAQWITTAKNVSLDDRLIAERIKLNGMDPTLQPAYLDDLIGRHGKSDAAAVGHWLIDLGLADRALTMPELSPESAASEITTYEARLQALVRTRRWQEAWQWLQQPPKGVHVVLQGLARAQVAHQLNRVSDRRQSLAKAIDAAGIMSSENNFFAISEIANQLGEYELATQAAMEGVQVPYTIAPPAPFFLPALRYLWQQDRLDEFRQLNLMLLLREPGDLQRNNDELYLSLLLDENPKLREIAAIGRKLVAAKPNDLSFSTTLAWALLRSGESQQAQEVLSNPKLDWKQAGPADLLVRDLGRQATSVEGKVPSELTAGIETAQLCSAEQELLLKVWQSQQIAP